MATVSREEVEAALDKVRPALQSDGGDVVLLDIDEDNIVKLHLVGACSGCPSATFTLAMGIERVLKDLVPGVQGIETI